MKESYFFISDVHLGLQSKEIEKQKERKLVELLLSIKDEAKELFILGDLFDYWFEYKRVYQKGFFRTLTALQDLSENETKIHYIIGNHDFAHKDFFEKEIGAKLYHDAISIKLENKNFYLAHGDDLLPDDKGYKFLKKILRNRTLQKMYSAIHPDLGISLASGVSKTSRDHTSKRDLKEVDLLFGSAKKIIDENYDYVILGHSHKKAFEKYNGGYYINLGSWLSDPCYGIFANGNFKIVDWK